MITYIPVQCTVVKGVKEKKVTGIYLMKHYSKRGKWDLVICLEQELTSSSDIM